MKGVVTATGLGRRFAGLLFDRYTFGYGGLLVAIALIATALAFFMPATVGRMLLLRLDAQQPLRAVLAIPVRTPPADGRVQVLFSFDIKAALPNALPRGSYQCYLVFGDTVAGPRTLTVD